MAGYPALYEHPAAIEQAIKLVIMVVEKLAPILSVGPDFTPTFSKKRNLRKSRVVIRRC